MTPSLCQIGPLATCAVGPVDEGDTGIPYDIIHDSDASGGPSALGTLDGGALRSIPVSYEWTCAQGTSSVGEGGSHPALVERPPYFGREGHPYATSVECSGIPLTTPAPW